jgi:hypothetical protein
MAYELLPTVSYTGVARAGVRGPGGSDDQLSITFAVPCTSGGDIDEGTQGEYEELADERFEQLRPGQELA